MTDFSQVVNEEEAQTEGASGGAFVSLPAEEGVALFRLRDVLELGGSVGEYKGVANKKKPVKVTFQLVHPRHAINQKAEGDAETGPFTGAFVRYHEISITLNKSNSDKSKYMKLFNKLNFDGAVATPKGKVPSFVAFAGKAFLGEIHHNPNADASKPPYVNLDKGGEFTIGAPRVPKTDAMGAPTGEYNDIPCPELDGPQRVFLWETGVSDEIYTQMWNSIAIVGEKKDGTPFKNWIQEAILSADNTLLEGSRAQRLFGTSVAEAGLDDLIAAPVAETVVASTVTPVADAVPAAANTAVVDPLAALGI